MFKLATYLSHINYTKANCERETQKSLTDSRLIQLLLMKLIQFIQCIYSVQFAAVSKMIGIQLQTLMSAVTTAMIVLRIQFASTHEDPLTVFVREDIL